MRKNQSIIILACLLWTCGVMATIQVDVYDVDGEGYLNAERLGTVTFQDWTEGKGLLISGRLEDLPPGQHGFHIHEKADCSERGLAAGGHFDPFNTGEHEGPYRMGHLGDLPVLHADNQGRVYFPSFAPRLSEDKIHKRALIIHKLADNYSDDPKPLGGGGDRFACGIIG